MLVGSLCSGVGGIDLGFERAGMTTVGLVEFDEKCQDVLRRHFPNAALYGDLREFSGNRGSADVIVGGTPCQDLSVAGKRAGLDGERSSLFYDYARVIDEIGPEWIVWENVPGALTSNRGRDMGAVLGTLADLGYGVAYRVLDAQFFGVAQRRRRVVLVGRRGDVGSAAAVLALGESVPGNPREGREARQAVARVAADGADVRLALPPTGDADVAGTFGSLTGGFRSTDLDTVGAYVTHYRKSRKAQSNTDYETWVEDDTTNTLSVFDNTGDVRAIDLFVYAPSREVASTLLASAGHHGHSSPRGDGSDNLVSGFTTYPESAAGSLTTRYGKGINTTVDDGAVVIPFTLMPESGQGADLTVAFPTELASGITAAALSKQADRGTRILSLHPTGVRRLTPRECERLQGFPDDWTATGASGAAIADTHRYRMMGNSVAVPVFEWVGRRMMAVQQAGLRAAA